MLFLWAVYIYDQFSGTWGSSGIQLLKCGRLIFLCSQTIASSSVVVTEVQPFDRCTSGLPRIHTDSLHRRLPNRMRCLPRRTHKSSGNEGNSTVIETLTRSDSKTVSVDSHRQYDSGGLSSESRGSSLLFPVSSMQRNYFAMRQSPDCWQWDMFQAIRI